MGNNKGRYQVLWVDEEPDTIQFKDAARRFELNLHQFRSWDKARTALNNRFENYSAIVLDGNCIINTGEDPDPDFLYQAVREMEAICAQHDESLPWYVLSSGTAPDFERTLQRVSKGQRTMMEPEWGRLYYRKSSDLDDLCLAIKHAAASRKDNKVRTLYRDVFTTMDTYFTPDSTRTMLDILCALHYPEDNRKFDPVLYYTQLRRILEHLFRAANRIGILPDEALGDRDKVNLSNSSLYLSGREIYTGRKTMRYGQPGESVFPPVIAQIVKSVLVVANKNSHTVELDTLAQSTIQDYYNSIQSNNFLFGYALHLCDVITWFGRYARNYMMRQNQSFKRPGRPHHSQRPRTPRPPQEKKEQE